MRGTNKSPIRNHPPAEETVWLKDVVLFLYFDDKAITETHSMQLRIIQKKVSLINVLFLYVSTVALYIYIYVYILL